MARSTPAQKPRGCAIRISASGAVVSSDMQGFDSRAPAQGRPVVCLENADQLDIEQDGLSGQRVVEVEQRRRLADLLEHAGVLTTARRIELDQVARGVVLFKRRVLAQ